MDSNGPDESRKRPLAENELDIMSQRKRIMGDLIASGRNDHVLLFEDDDSVSDPADFFVDHHDHTATSHVRFPPAIPAMSAYQEYIPIENPVWEESPVGVTLDQATHCTVRTEILWGDEEKAKFEHGMMREIDFFNFMFPVDFFQLMVECTNGNLVTQNLALTSVGEMYRMLGIKLAMALEGRQGLNVDFWSVQQDASSVYRPHKYGERFGMSKTRFDHLVMCWALDHSTAHLGGQGLGGILTLLTVFNRRREGCMRPGNLLCINESYTSWSGWPRTEAPTWLFPTYSTWSRLDVQRHSQLKSCVDANTGIVLRLEFAESEHVLSQKAAAQHCSPPTGLVLRLTEPWHKKEGRIVAVNRGMASVECLKACEQVGLKFIGSIKQNNLGYPKSHFDKFEAETNKEMSRGAMKVLASPYRLPNEPEDRLHFMSAIWFKSNKKSISLLANALTTEAVSYTLPVNAFGDMVTVSHPKCVDIYYRGITAVHMHDYFREGKLGVESVFRNSPSVWHQIFGSVFGISIVDAFLAYKHTKGDLLHQDVEFITQELMVFCGKLAHQMIHNNYEGGLPVMPPLVQMTCEEHKLVSIQVAIQQLGQDQAQKDWQLKCKVCGGKTRKFCLKCSHIESKKLFGICNDSTAKLKTCFAIHKNSNL